MMDKFFKFKKFIFRRLIFLILFIVNWVNKILFDFGCNGIKFKRFLLLIIIFAVCVEI